jgi:hypothetical protein
MFGKQSFGVRPAMLLSVPETPTRNDDAFEVIGEDVEAHFDSHVLQGTRLQVASSHPVLNGTEDVLDRLS